MKKLTQDEFIDKAKLIHGDKYDYSLVDYVKSKTKVKIICPIHGIFEQRPNDHLCNYGCVECGRDLNKFKTRKNTDEFILQASNIHINLYDYSQVNYINAFTKVKIICPIHGEFTQLPNSHLNGSGCSICKNSRGERLIQQLLVENNIKFIPQKTFNNCRGKRNLLPFDFYLPDYNTCIEYDGEQHFTGWNHNKDYLKLSQERDAIKTDYCNTNNISLIRIRYDEDIKQRVLKLL